MNKKTASKERRNLPLLTGQSTLAQAAWMMASPSIVLTFLAVSLDMPIFLVGALVSIRQAASSLTDIFSLTQSPGSEIGNAPCHCPT